METSEAPPAALSPELEQWIAYAVLTGHPDEVILPQLAGAGVPLPVAASYLQELRRSPLYALGSEFARKLGQCRWLLQLQKTVQSNSRASLDGQLPRLQREELSRFQQDFLAANRPVIVEGLLDDWPALQNWNQANLASRLGQQAIQYTQYYIENNQYLPEQREASFEDFLARVYDPNLQDPIYWTAYNQGEQNSPLLEGLMQDIRFPDGYCQAQKEMRTYFWIGPANTRSGLHFDPYNVLFAQVVGQKRFLLFPPQDIPRAYLENEYFSRVDAEAPDLEQFPLFAGLEPLVVDLNPGECLLLPVGWLHQVRSLSISMSVSLTCLELPSGQLNSFQPPSQFEGLL